MSGIQARLLALDFMTGTATFSIPANARLGAGLYRIVEDQVLGKRTASAELASGHGLPDGADPANKVAAADPQYAQHPVAQGGDAQTASGGCAQPDAGAPLPEGTIESIINGMPGGLDGYLKTWGWLDFAREIEKALGWAWQPEFDGTSSKQEELVVEFCLEIAGRKGGEKGRNPDPMRLLEMAQALYEAEKESASCGG